MNYPTKSTNPDPSEYESVEQAEPLLGRTVFAPKWGWRGVIYGITEGASGLPQFLMAGDGRRRSVWGDEIVLS